MFIVYYYIIDISNKGREKNVKGTHCRFAKNNKNNRPDKGPRFFLFDGGSQPRLSPKPFDPFFGAFLTVK